MKGKTGRDEINISDTVMESSWLIARGSSESAYIWYFTRVEKAEIVGDGNSVD